MAIRIFSSADGSDPMLLDSANGLLDFHKRLNEFLASAAVDASFPALTNGNPEPYTEFLGGLRVRRTTQNSNLHISEDRWLELTAPLAELLKFSACFSMEDGEHRHWYSSPVSLIIEADEWRSHRD